MARTNFILLFVLLLTISCKNDTEPESTSAEKVLKDNTLTGQYDGYKIFNKSATDSVAVLLKVEKNTETKWTIIEITPFPHTLSIELTGLNFKYDRGLGEDHCGATRMTGNGYFKEDNLYFIETTQCIKANAPDKYVEYRVSKK